MKYSKNVLCVMPLYEFVSVLSSSIPRSKELTFFTSILNGGIFICINRSKVLRNSKMISTLNHKKASKNYIVIIVIAYNIDMRCHTCLSLPLSLLHCVISLGIPWDLSHKYYITAQTPLASQKGHLLQQMDDLRKRLKPF